MTQVVLRKSRYPADRKGMSELLENECPICSGPHDEEIHAATTRVHAWFRQEVERSLVRPDENQVPVMPLAVQPDAAA